MKMSKNCLGIAFSRATAVCFDATNPNSVLCITQIENAKIRLYPMQKAQKDMIYYDLVGLECSKETEYPRTSLSFLIKLKSFAAAHVVSRCAVAFKRRRNRPTTTWRTGMVCCRDAAYEQKHGVSHKTSSEQRYAHLHTCKLNLCTLLQ